MRILGISNPDYLGVTLATKAIVTDYYPMPHIDQANRAAGLAAAIARWKPDLLVVGGWARGYVGLLESLARGRDFPILCVYHSTSFHGRFFSDDQFLPQVARCIDKSFIDYFAYVHPEQVRYEQVIRKKPYIWIPHSFKSLDQVQAKEIFTIGVLGGTQSILKNSEGAIAVAEEYVRNTEDTKLIQSKGYDKSHDEFMMLLRKCSAIIHSSHLECYSNTIQEAWSCGIPVIFGPASSGLSRSPLLTHDEQNELNRRCLVSPTDPYELYRMLELTHHNWQAMSDSVHRIYQDLGSRTDDYISRVFKGLKQHYHSRRPGLPDICTLPFTSTPGSWL